MIRALSSKEEKEDQEGKTVEGEFIHTFPAGFIHSNCQALLPSVCWLSPPFLEISHMSHKFVWFATDRSSMSDKFPRKFDIQYLDMHIYTAIYICIASMQSRKKIQAVICWCWCCGWSVAGMFPARPLHTFLNAGPREIFVEWILQRCQKFC